DALGMEGKQLIARELADALVVQGAIATRSLADVTGTIENIALVMTVTPKRSTAVTVTDANGTIEERVAPGALFLVPTTGGATVSVTGSVDRQDVGPLALGIIVDARGRPLELPQRDAEWRTVHELPLGVSQRAEVGQRVHAGDVIASGATYGSNMRVAAARRLGVAPHDLERVM